MKRLTALLVALASCAATGASERRGDEIVICGRYVPTGARVVLWSDPEGFDAYSLRSRWRDDGGREAPRYGRRRGLPERPRLAQVGAVVDQLVLHYDAAGTSRRCFEVLHDLRTLSAHFLLDRDGTIYQTLDVQERAWHAGTANDRSVGVEIANVGAYADLAKLREARRVAGVPGIDPPRRGRIHGVLYHQDAYTDAQYEALARLTVALARTLPKLRLEAPADRGGLAPAGFAGIVAHSQLTRRKVDPGPAFDWERYLALVRTIG